VRGLVLVVVVAKMFGCKDTRPPPPPTSPPPTAAAPTPTSPAPPAPVDAPGPADDRLDTLARLYDRADFAGAAVAAEAILRTDPDNIRALRIAISSYCALGEVTNLARAHWRRLPPKDQQDMSRRCERYGVTLR